MNLSADRPSIAYYQNRRIASGGLLFVSSEVKRTLQDDADQSNILDSVTGETIEIDFRGSLDELSQQFSEPANVDNEPAEKNNSPEASLSEAEKPKRGRPKLGVIPREVTLLPRHWEWLKEQRGGASVALRKLVEEARKKNESKDNLRKAQSYLYRFMTTMASHYPEYEEALRMLYAGDSKKFEQYISSWPTDIVAQIKKMAVPAFHKTTLAT